MFTDIEVAVFWIWVIFLSHVVVEILLKYRNIELERLAKNKKRWQGVE